MKKVKGYIRRSSLLYLTAVEYGDYTMNHVQGCAHGCKYPCYAFLLKRRFGQIKTYEDWKQPYLVANTLELLDKEIPKLKHKIKSVQLCFTTDPFMYQYPEIEEMSLSAIKKLNSHGIKCCVLTKGILPLELADFSERNEYGITLISLDEKFREKMEPGAAPLQKRLQALKDLHKRGCYTWVSIEPYPTPNIIEQDLNALLSSVSFVDKMIFGRMNYNKEVTRYDGYRSFFNEQAERVVSFCEQHKIAYHIKEGTCS